MSKFLNSVWATLLISIAIATIVYFLTGRIFGQDGPVLISVAVAIVTFIMTQKLIMERETKKDKVIEDEKIKKELDCRPTFKYVNDENDKIMLALNMHIDASNEINKQQIELFKSIDNKVDVLIGLIGKAK